MVELVKDSVNEFYKWESFENKPPKSCKILAITSDGKVSSGEYVQKDDRYRLDINQGDVRYWCLLPENPSEFVMFRNDTCQVVSINAPEDGEPLAMLGGFGMFVNYNFQNMQTEQDIERAADAFGQYFYEHAIDTLNNIKK